MLQAAATKITSRMRTGLPTRGQTGALIERVGSDLYTTIALLDLGDQRICLVISPLEIRGLQFRQLLLPRLSECLGLPKEQILLCCDHNHSVPCLYPDFLHDYQTPTPVPAKIELLNPLGVELLQQILDAARDLPERLQPVSLSFGSVPESRIAYNRKGHWPDGTTYFIREKERLERGDDYSGVIDPDADVLSFHATNGKPVLTLCRHTAHPVTAYHPEHMIAYGDWPQLACDHLREALGDPDAPVAFLQGCCGNVNSRFFLTGDLDRSRELGSYLGASFTKAYQERQLVDSEETFFQLLPVDIPFAPLPTREELVRELEEIRAFEENPHTRNRYGAYSCVGLNFPEVLSAPYRSAVIRMNIPWYEWAIEQHDRIALVAIPRSLSIRCPLLRFGHLALIGLPFEPYVETGLLLKKTAHPLHLLPCGYINQSYGYIPDSAGVGDREYMSSFYRYTRFYPPYAKPAGDAITPALAQALKG